MTALHLQSPLHASKSMYDYPKQCPTPSISSVSSSRSPSPDFSRAVPGQLPCSPSTLSSLSLDLVDEDVHPDPKDRDRDRDQGQDYDPDYDPDYTHDHDLSLHIPDSPCIPKIPAADDSAVDPDPSRHVDYLSHEWNDEVDICASWRYIAARRDAYSNGLRLENAAWRTWAKFKLNLPAVSPESLNWLKDCDVTWLYGPLKTNRLDETASNSNVSPPPSQLETPAPYDRKPILKKKSASEAILQRSLSQHTLLQHAGAILKAQEADNDHRSAFPRPTATRNQVSPMDDLPNERRHIHFNNEVSQCIAVEAKGDDTPVLDDTHDSIAMKQVSPAAPSDPRCNNHENRTIAPLPSTTLKYRGDTPPPSRSLLDRWYNNYSTSSPSHSPSMETLRPSPSFPTDDDGAHPSSAFRSSSWLSDSDDEFELDDDLTSGEAAPYEDGEWAESGALDKVIDAVNTARDIAHVIWNVGWRR